MNIYSATFFAFCLGFTITSITAGITAQDTSDAMIHFLFAIIASVCLFIGLRLLG